MSGRARHADYLAAPMRMIVVPHTGHLPFIAGFPFLRVMAAASFISRLALHFTQYAWTMSFASRPESRAADKHMGEKGNARKSSAMPRNPGFLGLIFSR